MKATLLVFLMGTMWVVTGVANKIGIGKDSSEGSALGDLSLIEGAFSVPRASADSPHYTSSKSLEVSYWNGEAFDLIDVVQPRYYQKNVNILEIPSSAMNEKGETRVLIRATKRHAVTTAFLAAPSERVDSDSETLKVKKATLNRTGKDHSSILNKKNSREYLNTISGDKVDIEFESSTITKLQGSNMDSSQPVLLKDDYLIHVNGFYLKKTEETRQRAGKWVSRLDPDSRKWLEKMYELKGYDSSNSNKS